MLQSNLVCMKIEKELKANCFETLTKREILLIETLTKEFQYELTILEQRISLATR